MIQPGSVVSDEAFTVYDAREADAPRLAEFGARTFYESFAAQNNPDDMRRHLDASFAPERQLAEIRDSSLTTLIERDTAGNWVGFAQLRAGKVSDGVPAQGSIELWRFYVDKPWHGGGAARTLMHAAKQRARALGATTIWLGVWSRNARAQAFYRKHGFAKVGAHVFVVGTDPQTDDVMLCAL